MASKSNRKKTVPSLRKNKTVMVVGGGAGGLASAVLLQNAGFDVTVLEKNPEIGGKLNQETLDGFVFDTGPSILTLPGVLKELFALTGKDLSDYLTLVPLDTQWRCWFQDGTQFDFKSGEEAMLEEIRTFAPGDVDGFRNLLLRAREMYRLSEDNFFFRDLGNVLDIVKSGNTKPLQSLQLMMSIQPLNTYAGLVERYIRNPHLRQSLEHLPQYIGSSPFLAPAILGCLIHVQFEKGCWYPMGGMNQISHALAKRFEELGGKIVLNTSIERVFEDGRSIRGVEAQDGYLWTADEYVFNVDINTLMTRMNKPTSPDSELACSGVTVFLGLSKKVQNLAHHNFFFSKSHKDEFRDLYESGVPHQDPTVYVCVPSVTDSTVAPAGKENVFLLIHAPTVNQKTNWSTYLSSYVELIEKKLGRMGFDIAAAGVEVRKSRSPQDIGEKWGTYKGNIYGLASHGRFAGAFKRGNASREFSNLQYSGGTVNPGAGVPMSLMSGMISAANLIQKSHSLVDLRL